MGLLTATIKRTLIWLRSLYGRARQAHYSFMVVMAVLIGFVGGFVALGFRYLIEGATWVFSGGTTLVPSGFEGLEWWWILLMPAVGGLLVGILVKGLAC
jgi:CIC family chloride channel protein